MPSGREILHVQVGAGGGDHSVSSPSVLVHPFPAIWKGEEEEDACVMYYQNDPSPPSSYNDIYVCLIVNRSQIFETPCMSTLMRVYDVDVGVCVRSSVVGQMLLCPFCG